jgi:hypothetical protein
MLRNAKANEFTDSSVQTSRATQALRPEAGIPPGTWRIDMQDAGKPWEDSHGLLLCQRCGWRVW